MRYRYPLDDFVLIFKFFPLILIGHIPSPPPPPPGPCVCKIWVEMWWLLEIWWLIACAPDF